MTEHEIIAGLNNGVEKCYDHIFHKYYDALFFFALQIVKDRDIAQEVTHDAFFKLWQKRADFDMEQKVKAFLYIAVKNACLNCLKESKRRKAAEGDIIYLSEKVSEQVSSAQVTAELFSLVMTEARSLKGKAWDIFKLKYLHELSYKEIAEHLGMSVDNVRVQHSNAMASLRLLLKKKNLLGIAIIFTLLFI